MAFTPQNFVDKVGPTVSAAFLNALDVTVNQALQGVQTTAQLIALVGGGGGGGPPVNPTILVVSSPAIVVPADPNGVVLDFSNANGQAQLFTGNTDVTSAATLSITTSNCTATINTAPNVPVNFQPIGFYQFTGLTGASGTATITASLGGVNYSVNVKIVAASAGSPGTPGTPGAPGTTGPTGPAGAGGITLVLSSAAATVLTYASGTVPSFAGLNGQASVLNAGVNESELATWSAVGSGLTGTVNTADNVPVAGHPIGYYQVTAMSSPIGTLTISAVYLANTLTAIYQVTQVPTGYQIVSSLPVIPGPQSFEGNVVFLSTDGQLYRFHAGAWTTLVPAVNISGQLSAAQIASLAASQITGQLTAAQIASLTAAQLTGQITTTQITPGAITTPLLGAGSVNTAALAAGSVVAGSIASGTITAAQIAGGTIQGANIAAGTILAGNIAAATITAGNLAANSVTAGAIAANSVATNSIQAGAVTAAQIGVSVLSAISANIGAITAGTLSNAGGNSILDLNNGWMVFNNGVNMVVRGFGFGAASNYLDWFGPTQSAATNFAACTDNLGIYWLKTDGTYKFGVSLQASATTLFNSVGSFTYTIPAGKSQIFIELWGDSGFGGHGNGTDPGGGGGSGTYSKSSYMVSGHAGQTIQVSLTGGGTQGGESTVTSGTFTLTAMNAFGGLGGAVGAFGVAGAGGTGASGGNLINVPGMTGGDNISSQAGGLPAAGTYANGNAGAGGANSATTNRPGLPAVCAITAL